MSRNPSSDRNPLDLASFYIEELKYGPGPGQLESVNTEQITNQLEVLLRDAGVESMSGAELLEASEFYAESSAESYRASLILMRSVWIDGLMHGIALAAGLVGECREPREVT